MQRLVARLSPFVLCVVTAYASLSFMGMSNAEEVSCDPILGCSSTSSSSSSTSCTECGCGGSGEPASNTLEAGTEWLPTEDDIAPPSDATYETSYDGDMDDGGQFVSFPPLPPIGPIGPLFIPPLSLLWTPGPAPFRAMRDNLQPSATFGREDSLQFLRVRNRNAMVSNAAFPNGVCLTFQWRWTRGQPNGNYKDTLSVVFRTNGQQRAARSWEIQEGIQVFFTIDEIHVNRWTANEASPTQLGMRQGLNFAANVYHQISITERNDSIAIRYGPGANDVLTVDNLPARGQNNRIAIYNREPAAGVEQESHIAPPGNDVSQMLRALPQQQ